MKFSKQIEQRALRRKIFARWHLAIAITICLIDNYRCSYATTEPAQYQFVTSKIYFNELQGYIYQTL